MSSNKTRKKTRQGREYGTKQQQDQEDKRKKEKSTFQNTYYFIYFYYLLNELLGKPYAPINKNNFLQTSLLYCENRKQNSLIVN